MNKLVERFSADFVDYPFQKIYIVHGDCEEDANELKSLVEKALPESLKHLEVKVRKLGPIIGASCGPGTLGIYYFGTEVTHDSSKA